MQNESAEAAALLEYVLATAKRFGATSADAMFAGGSSTSARVRLGETEEVKRSRSHGVGLRVLVGQSSATTSTSDLDRGRLEDLIKRTCEAAQVTASDPHAGLPDAAQYEALPLAEVDLDLYDPSLESLDVDDALEMAREAESVAAQQDTRITNSEGGDISWGSSHSYLANSLGVFHERRGGSISLWTTPIAEQDGAMQRDYWYTWARHRSDLMAPEAVGKKAAERTLRRLNAVKPDTCQLPIIFEAPMASRLLGSLGGAISGGAIYRKASYLCDQLGEQITAEGVTIVDNPHIARGPASRLYDGEGLATQPLTVVEAGILKSYILDCYTARKLGQETTRHASRGLGGTPSPSCSNLWMSPGDQSLEALIASTKRGILITELFGFGVNTVTGDYSQGAAGLFIEDGEVSHAVSEFTIASTLPRIWKEIDGIANDLATYRATSSPSFRVSEMTVAGN